MIDVENEYLGLPDDPEEAFSVLQQNKWANLQTALRANEFSDWSLERRYVDNLIAFDQVHDLGIFKGFQNPPYQNNDFAEFFVDFCRHAEVSAQTIMMEAARRQKIGVENVVVFDATMRKAIHTLIGSLRDRLTEWVLPEDRRQSLFNKLNAFAAEVDRNRTRTEAFFAFAVEAARTAREVNDEIKPLQQTIDRLFEWLEKAKKIKDVLPPWGERKKIEGPRKALPKPDEAGGGFSRDMDDEIPF